MNKLMQLLRFSLCTFTVVASASTLAGQNILYYTSQPGDFLGQGAEVLLTGAEATFSSGVFVQSAARVTVFKTNVFSLYGLNIASADGALLTPGAYEGAQRAGFQQPGHPGLDFTAEGRGCNTATGRFDLLEIVRDTTGLILQLAVNWEEHCDGATPATFGQLRYNSDIPILKPLTITLENPLNTRGCVEASSQNGALVSVDANSAIDGAGGRSFLFNWSSTTGDVGTSPTFSFNGPLTTNPQQPIVVTLSLTDLTNNTVRTIAKTICVSDTTGPVIVINSPVPGQTVHGDTLVLDVTIKDAVDKNITQYEILVGNDYLAPISPSTGRAKQNILAAPKANGSIALTITVRAVDIYGNTAQRSVTVTQFP